jgi:hypothetical protein
MWACSQEGVGPADQSLITDFFRVVSGRRQQGDGLGVTRSHAFMLLGEQLCGSGACCRILCIWKWCRASGWGWYHVTIHSSLC